MALLALGLTAFAAPASAGEVHLIFATLNPPGTPINDRMLHPWADAINKEGAGIIHLDVRDGYAIANFGNIYDRVLSNVVQVAWALQPPIGGKFLLSSVASLPFLTKKSADASAALWRLYDSGLLKSEYSEIQPLMLAALPQSGLQLAKPLDNYDNMGGRKIAIADKIQADAVSALGGVPQSVQLPDLFEALQRGTVEGAAFGYAAFPPFRINEVTSVHVEVPLGASTGMVFMSKKTWDSLPQAAKDILAKHMGLDASRHFGEYWDGADAFGRSMVADKPGHTIVDLTAEQSAAWQAKVEPIVNGFAASLPNGPAVLAKYKELLAEETKN
jgi:TRAP-type C4-dicarboxylate transport system substrate-binding protein